MQHADHQRDAVEHRWRELFELAPCGIFRLTLDGEFVLANPAFLATLRYESTAELSRVRARDMFADPERDWNAVCEIWSSKGAAHPVEVTWHARDGGPVGLLLWGRQLEEPAGVFEVFAQDLTERRRLEEEFRQAQKMEAVGRLAGGIAHDFNNLLTAILGYSEMALEGVSTQDPLHADLREIRQAAQRAGALTQQLLAFSRRQVLKLVPVELNSVITGIEPMVRRLIGEHIRVEWRPTPNIPLIKADAAQLEQVLLNLVVNARDAMPAGGTVAISTAVTALEAGTFGPVPPVSGRYVLLQVTDTGEGMDAATQARIFEPFFTTKERGKGTGLGLSTVYGIVKQLTGYITVVSRPGHGTTFNLYFPPAAAGDQVEAAVPEAVTERKPGRETILLVEDEDVLRRLAHAVLERQGYRVIDASGPEEALALGRQHPDAIDLILADVLMPGMRGWEMVDRLKPLQPRARVLYMSGYVDELEKAKDRVTPLLSKPFKPRELLDRIRTVLDS